MCPWTAPSRRCPWILSRPPSLHTPSTCQASTTTPTHPIFTLVRKHSKIASLCDVVITNKTFQYYIYSLYTITLFMNWGFLLLRIRLNLGFNLKGRGARFVFIGLSLIQSIYLPEYLPLFVWPTCLWETLAHTHQTLRKIFLFKIMKAQITTYLLLGSQLQDKSGNIGEKFHSRHKWHTAWRRSLEVWKWWEIWGVWLQHFPLCVSVMYHMHCRLLLIFIAWFTHPHYELCADCFAGVQACPACPYADLACKHECWSWQFVSRDTTTTHYSKVKNNNEKPQRDKR